MRYQSTRRHLHRDDWELFTSAIYWGTRPRNTLDNRTQEHSAKDTGNRRWSWHQPEDRQLTWLVGFLVCYVLLALSTAAFA